MARSRSQKHGGFSIRNHVIRNRKPRIGDAYQAELPTCMSPLRKSADTAVETYPHQSIVLSSPSRLVQINGQNHGNLETVSDSVEPEMLCSEEQMQEAVEEVLVPGSVGENWGDDEKGSFLLALYIFGKNFVGVKQLVETRNMGAILAYYYKEFYHSEEHQRWSEYRKEKKKEHERPFCGLPMEEFLSRTMPIVTDESKSALLEEVSTRYKKGKISLAECVSALKAIVGMDILLEAVCICTGKHDLVGRASKPSKRKEVIPVRPKMPVGKACALLTNTEIVELLNGNFRMYKARTKDLFWLAVWPRLVANGWSWMTLSRHCSVFLTPHSKKFSRKLLKGTDYYDSETDVLKRVAREPELLNKRRFDKNETCSSTKGSTKSSTKASEPFVQIQNSTPATPEMSNAPNKPCSGDEDMMKVGELDADEGVGIGNTKRSESGRTVHRGRKRRNGNVSLQEVAVHDSEKDMSDNKRCKKVAESQSSQKQKESDAEPPNEHSQESIADNQLLENVTASVSAGTVAHESYQDSSSMAVVTSCPHGHESYLDSSSVVGSLKGSPKQAGEGIEQGPIDENHLYENGEPRASLDLNHALDDGEMRSLIDLNVAASNNGEISSDHGNMQPLPDGEMRSLIDLNIASNNGEISWDHGNNLQPLPDGDMRPLIDLNIASNNGEISSDHGNHLQPLPDLNLTVDHGITRPSFDLNLSSDDVEICLLIDPNRSPNDGDTHRPHPLPELNQPDNDGERHRSFDLNVPYVPLDLNLPHLPLEVLEKSTESGDQIDQTQNTEEVRATEQHQNPSIPVRRHSGRRNRPPTARVLEAVADGYLAANPRPQRRMKRNRAGSNAEASPRPSRRARVSAHHPSE